jgi:hypothetical protein
MLNQFCFFGADDGTRTHTSVARHPLKMVRLPVPPHPHGYII